MKELHLTAKDTQEQKVLAYLQENASDVLAEKINNGTPFEKDGHPLINKKTLSGFMKYACDEAQKLAEKGARSTCVDDDVVYGWAIHYFEEESIEGTLYTLDGEEYKPAPKKANKPTTKPSTKVKEESKKPQNFQFSLFDNLTENDVNNAQDDTLTCETVENEDIPTADIVPQEKPKVSPLWLRYKGYQEEHPTAIVAMRLGDFYEIFGDDAVKVASVADLTLTGRDCGLENRVPMVGFPYHAAQNYIEKIVAAYDLYIVENDDEKRFVPHVEPVEDWLDDEDFSEEEMHKFDGDLDESVCDAQDITTPIIQALKDIFGSALEVR